MQEADDFDEFYATTSARLVGQVFAMTGDLGEAEDAVQEAYIRAWGRWARIRAYDDPEAWLRTVAYRISMNSWRKARNRLAAHRRASHSIELPGLLPDLLALVSALRKIPEAQRRVIVLHHLVGLPVEQIAIETVGVVAAGVGLGVTHTGASTPTHTASPAQLGPVRLTAEQVRVLARAHLTTAELVALARVGFTTAELKQLAAANLSAAQIAAFHQVVRSVDQITAMSTAHLTAIQLAALGREKLTAAQIAALRDLKLTAVQISALGKANLTAAQLAGLS